MGRCRRCYTRQVEEEGREEQDVVLETYQGESSRSVVTRARSHYEAYKLAMKKKPRPCRATPGGEEQEQEESSSWMADHTRSHHEGIMSEDLTDDSDFFVVGRWNKPLHRLLEETIRIRIAKTRGILVLGRGKRKKRWSVNRNILNRKLKNFSPFFLTLGGWEGEE